MPLYEGIAPSAVQTPPQTPWTVAQYGVKLQQHWPTGRVWPRDVDATQSQAALAWAPTYNRLDAAAIGLLEDIFPATTQQLLPEWQSTLGLPDPCIGAEPSLAAEQAQVVARLVFSGGCTPAFFIGFAATLGVTDLTITVYPLARCGATSLGHRLYGTTWAFVWVVKSAALTMTHAKCGVARCKDPIAVFGGLVIPCEFARFSPAHTELVCSYKDPSSGLQYLIGA